MIPLTRRCSLRCAALRLGRTVLAARAAPGRPLALGSALTRGLS